MGTGQGLKQVSLSLPATEEGLRELELGSAVFLTGTIYTGREGVYKRVIEEGHPPPVDLRSLSNVNFHCSPAAARQDDGSYRVGAVTATASFRFSKWMPTWFETSGARIIIGKGGMAEKDYKETFRKYGAVYLTTVGYGTGALLGRGIKRVKDVYWMGELGIAQAMWVLEVENFGPLLVDGDLDGNSLFEQQGRLVNQNLGRLYEGLKPPAMRRYGETDDRSEEVV